MLRFLLLSLFIVQSVVAANQSFKLTPKKSNVKWTGSKVTGKHWGTVKLKSGKLVFKDGDLSSGEIIVDVSSLTVDDIQGEYQTKLLNHLKSDDFFNTKKFKTATLTVTQVSKIPGGELNVHGDLKVKGKSHAVSFPVRVNKEGKMLTAKGKLKFDRTWYDIRYGSGKFFENLGDKMIHDDVELEFNVSGNAI